MRKIATLSMALLCLSSGTALAQTDKQLPPLPAALKTYVDQGAQIRYMGRDHGYDGWMTVMQGQIEYYYVPAKDQNVFFRGLMFDGSGKALTLDHVEKLKSNSDEILNLMVGQKPQETKSQESEVKTQIAEPKSLSEQLFENVENANWIALGNPDAPYIYTFVDPRCKHCHKFTNDLYDNYIHQGKLQMRIIPVGFISDASIPQAAFLLGAENAGKRWIDYVKGDTAQIPVSEGLNTQGVENNNAIMLSWKLNATPITVYRSSKTNKVKIIEGPARDINALIQDLY